MAIDLTGNTGRTLLADALAQDDVDMNHFKLLNLDTSNLTISAAPPTIRRLRTLAQIMGQSQQDMGRCTN